MVDQLPSRNGLLAGVVKERRDGPPADARETSGKPATRPTDDTPSETPEFLRYWMDSPRSSPRD